MLGQLFQEFVLAERLAHQVIASGGQNVGLLVFQGAGSQGNDHRVIGALGASRRPDALHGPDAPRGLIAIHHGHLDVHPDQVWRPLLPDLDRFLPICGFAHLKTERLQELDQQPAAHLVVFDD